MPTEKQCPKCHSLLKIIPAGVSKASGKPYKAFYSCPSRCELKGIMDTRVDAPGWDESKFIPRRPAKEEIPVVEDKVSVLNEIALGVSDTFKMIKRVLEILEKEMPEEEPEE